MNRSQIFIKACGDTKSHFMLDDELREEMTACGSANCQYLTPQVCVALAVDGMRLA